MRIKKVSESILPKGHVIDSLQVGSSTNAPSINAVNEGIATLDYLIYNSQKQLDNVLNDLYGFGAYWVPGDNNAVCGATYKSAKLTNVGNEVITITCTASELSTPIVLRLSPGAGATLYDKGYTYTLTATIGSSSYTGDEIATIVTRDILIKEPKDYSTEESLTGKVWIDGKPVYKQTFVFPLTGTYVEGGKKFTFKSFSDRGLSVDSLISLTGFVKQSNGYILPLPSTDDVVSAVMTNPSSFQVGLKSEQQTGQNIYITIEYTRTTDN